MVELFTREMFNDFLNLCIFSLFVISIINRLISDDGDFVCCRVISEMQHAMETRLPFYKWRYEYLLNLRDRVAFSYALFMSWINETSETSRNHCRASHRRKSIKRKQEKELLKIISGYILFTASFYSL